MSLPLTRSYLDVESCQTPGCTHEDHSVLYLHSRCHPSAGTRASYDKRTGVLTISCRQCRKLVANIQVAS